MVSVLLLKYLICVYFIHHSTAKIMDCYIVITVYDCSLEVTYFS